MLDDLNENNDNLTDNSAASEEDNTSLLNDEVNNSTEETLPSAEENTVETSPMEENPTAQEEESSSALGDGEVDTNSETNEESTPSSSTKNEDNNSISADLIRGHINTIILRALLERDKYGYEIINDIESKSHGQYTLKQPTLYSALKRLENQGYIKAYWKTDEVTLGGRRKYFKLTESGKAITEKNLSEWEYSRTIIDSLISDKSFDFAKPAPTAVDFTLLRDSVSRVPTVRNEEAPASENNQQTNGEVTSQQTPPQTSTQTTDCTSSQAIEYYSAISGERQQANQPTQSEGEQATQQPAQPIQSQHPTQEQLAQEAQAQALTEAQAQEQIARQQAEEEAARRRTHENYMRLISEPVRRQPTQVEDTVPGSENINSDKLLYNNRPETERDYRNMVDGIFSKTINHGSVQTTFHSRQADATQRSYTGAQSRQTAGTKRLVDKGASDGVSITPSNERNSSRATKTTYNKGLTLLKSSAVVFVILIIEAILCYVFKDWLAITWVYPAVILAIGVVQFGIILIMALNGYGKRSVLPTSHGYVSTCVILTIIFELIIAMLAFLLNVNMSVINDILIKLVIPAVTALNLTIFGICYRAFIK